MRPYIKRRRFFLPFSDPSRCGVSSAGTALALEFLNQTSVFETMRCYGSRFFLRDQHWQRLTESCAAIGRRLPLSKKEFWRWMASARSESGFRDALLRLSVHWAPSGNGLIVLVIRPFLSHLERWYQKGVTLRSTVYRRPSPKAVNPQTKASQYVSGVLAALDATGDGTSPSSDHPHELVFFGPGGTVAEGTVSNIFIVKEKSLLTPSASSGILKGVTRAWVLGLARKRGWPVIEIFLTRHDLYAAEECFITNTSSEVLPVVSVDGRQIGDGKPGPFTQALREDFKGSR